MSKKCIKCGYVRDDELDKNTPDSECPRCGVIYAKAKANSTPTPPSLNKHVHKTAPKEQTKETNKNLTKCKDCGGKVSKNAKTCPHCGLKFTTVPQKITQFGCGLMSLGIIIPIVFIAFLMIFDSGTKDKKPQPTEAKKEQPTEAKKEKVAEPYPCRVIKTQDISHSNTKRMVYRIYLKTQAVPNEEQMKATAKQIWKTGNKQWDEFTVFMIFGKITTFKFGAYGVCEFTPSGLSKFFINDAPLQMLKLKFKTE